MEVEISSLASSWPNIVVLVGAVMTAFAVGFAFKSYRRKTGADIRCTFGVSLSVVSPEPWVSDISLRNGKDRSVAIYNIYLEVGYGFFVEVEDLTSSPIVLEPYGAWHREYDPVDAYVSNLRRWTDIFDRWHERPRVLLITSEGRHFAKLPKPALGPPEYSSLKNHATVTVSPQRLNLAGRYVGTRTRYWCAITSGNGQRSEFPIYKDAVTNQVENGMTISDDILGSVENVRAFLQGEMQAGRLPGIQVEVSDITPRINAMNERYHDSVPYTSMSWFEYKVMNRLITMFSRRKRYKILHYVLTKSWNWINRMRGKDSSGSTRTGPQEISIRSEGADSEMTFTTNKVERGSR